MAALSDPRNVALARVIARCGDPMLVRLTEELSARPTPSARILIELIEAEQTDRRRRDFVFSAILPTFQPRADGIGALHLPVAVRDRMWRVAADAEAGFLEALAGPDATAVADRLCRGASSALRDHPDDIWPEAATDPDCAGALETLARRLDLAPLARQALAALPSWVARPTEQHQTTLRLLMRDADAIGEDGAVVMMEMLFSHLPDARQMVRVLIQAAASLGGAQFLMHSELGDPITRMMDGVEERSKRIAAWRLAHEGSADEAVGQDIVWCAAMLTELEISLSPSPESPWGRAIRTHTSVLSAAVSRIMAASQQAVETALPLARIQLAGRMTRLSPSLNVPFAGATADEARRGLLMLARIHGSAHVLGCEAERSRIVGELTDRLLAWADEALEAVNGGEVQNEANALGLVRLAADALELIEAPAAAQAVRRRAAVAGRYPTDLMHHDAGASPEAA